MDITKRKIMTELLNVLFVKPILLIVEILSDVKIKKPLLNVETK